MKNEKKKCNSNSSKEHGNADAIIYCLECNLYLCNKCETLHSKLVSNHHIFNLDKEKEEIFTGYCKKENHTKLEYFCKTHNELCCGVCIAKIKKEGNGQHFDCDVCIIEDIKDDKISKLKDNIKFLEELSNSIQQSIKDLKSIFEKMNESKEELKLNIQQIFTKIRSEINNREDQLLIEVDKKFEKLFCKEDIVKESEKLPIKIKDSLEKGKIIDTQQKENNDKNNLCSLINDCINIENVVKEINIINENIKNCDGSDEIKFEQNEDIDIDKLIQSIQTFGKINSYEKGKYKSFESSSIIKNDINKLNNIVGWIKEKTNKEVINFEIIFKMTENGYDSKDFHKFCDDKEPTLVLVKTKKDKIFGGFTPLNWKKTNSKSEKKDDSNQTFIFSLDIIKKFDIININKLAIQTERGPCFGACEFQIKSNMKEGVCYANNCCNFLSNNNLELTGGKGESENFETEEIEVYKVILK